MAVINILDKHTAELIAAGEVVEKPASVVKELVENSIDAGAKNILVDIENGGVKKILVQDDGCGIDSEYIKTAFVRHATSKISTKDDLDKIQSLGFRGEALASIAGVSRLSLISKTEQQDFGVEFKIEGGEETSFEIKPFVNGTRFTVNDLFYNTPARMKFLKKDATEAGYIQDIITNLALSAPNISFTFKKNDKDIFSTPGDGDLKNTIASLFGTAFAKEITELEYKDDRYSIDGFITHAHFSRQSRNMQFVFINGRYVKNKTVIAAVENAYKGSIMIGKFPGYILNITMPYDLIDVNVHPAKTEVRFSNDSEVFSAVYRGVKSALTGSVNLKEFNFTSKPSLETITNNKQTDITQLQLKSSFVNSLSNNDVSFKNRIILPDSDNCNSQQLKSSNQSIPYLTSEQEAQNKSYVDTKPSFTKTDVFIPVEEKYLEQDNQADTALQNTANSIIIEDNLNNDDKEMFISVIGEIFDTYILCESNKGLIVIDKHAAHERLLYEKLKKSACCDKQMLLMPTIIKLSAKEKEEVLENIDILIKQGFDIEDFGLNGIKLNAIPINMNSENPQSLFEEIAHNLSENKGNTLSEKQEWILHSVACRSAIKAGDKASIKELIQLVNDIEKEKIPLFCPHGRPIIVTITKKELEKQFGRA